ncbi:MAG: hypothetical protein HQL39_06715 [Alphaproteobacteria bacterium]|nr:hypothetical protein [Alphaproteobacteria bacterium]
MTDTSDSEADARARQTYRLELFLSVDVSGSTSFKFSNSLAGSESKSESGWLGIIGKFYQVFHLSFCNKPCFENAARPHLWKALGDELVYRVAVEDKHVIAATVQAFVKTVWETRETVRSPSKEHLDLKGTAWVADFPARNAVIPLDGLLNGLRDPYQDTPISSESPSNDFIGPSMDAGFRIGKVASRRRMALSVELALILASAQSERRGYTFLFGYDGREELKGVLGGESYPLIWLDVEDDPKRRKANRHESAMLRAPAEVAPDTVLDFCKSYIDSSPWMELPLLKAAGDTEFTKVPDSHRRFAAALIERERQEAVLYGQEASESADDEGGASAGDLLREMPVPDPAPQDKAAVT